MERRLTFLGCQVGRRFHDHPLDELVDLPQIIVLVREEFNVLEITEINREDNVIIRAANRHSLFVLSILYIVTKLSTSPNTPDGTFPGL